MRIDPATARNARNAVRAYMETPIGGYAYDEREIERVCRDTRSAQRWARQEMVKAQRSLESAQRLHAMRPEEFADLLEQEQEWVVAAEQLVETVGAL